MEQWHGLAWLEFGCIITTTKSHGIGFLYVAFLLLILLLISLINKT